MVSGERNYSIDFLKGILILIVIIGHVIPGEIEASLSRYLIYSFHMPIFIAVAGFMLPMGKLENMTYGGIAKKYVGRLMIPWMIAVNIYFFLVNVLEKDKITLWSYLEEYLYPYYHLWFVLGFLAYIFLTRFLLSLKCSARSLVTAAAAISIISCLANWIPNSGEGLKGIADYIQYDFRPSNYLFFILGMVIRKYVDSKGAKAIIKKSGIFAALFFAVVFALFFVGDPKLQDAVSFALNIPLAICVLSACVCRCFPRCRLIEFIGKNSFAFYLWHVLGKIEALKIVGDQNLVPYYFVNAVIFIAEIIIIYSFSRVRPLNKYLFGNN